MQVDFIVYVAADVTDFPARLQTLDDTLKRRGESGMMPGIHNSRALRIIMRAKAEIAIR